MEIFIPYLVLLLVVIVFFMICYFLFREKKKPSKTIVTTSNNYDSHHKESSKYIDYGAQYRMEEQSQEAKAVQDLRERRSETNQVIGNLPVVEDDLTTMMPSVKGPVEDKTILMPPVSEERPVVDKKSITLVMPQEKYPPGVVPFVNLYGYLTQEKIDEVCQITEEAFERLEMYDREEIDLLLENIVVQEALLCMQKAYSATPTEWMKQTALEAFVDVVQQPKSSTTYLVAFDALHILPHLTLGHFQAMAIILLFKYSRNSNNYSVKNFQHYVRKYVEPFLSDLLIDSSPYRQLDYLRCTVEERERETFKDMLSQTYPFVFNYEGFTMDELQALMGTFLSEEYVVKSVNSDLYKLAIVDEAMANRLFRLAKINDTYLQNQLMSLMKSRPTRLEGLAGDDILTNISPVLLGLSKTFDKSPLSQISLTLMGLYLARAHVKVTIGENFDLSRWF